MRELFQRDLTYLAGELPNADRDAGGTVALAHLARGHQLFDQGRFSDALDVYAIADAALQLLSGVIGDSPRLTLHAAIATSIADCHANLGNFDLAIAATNDALDRLKTAGHHWQRCRRQLLVSDRRAFYLAWMGRCDAALIESDAVTNALRALVRESTKYQTDLARSLDHRAEILERAHRLDQAAIAAEESTRIRRQLALHDSAMRIPFLRSLVTFARIVGNCGDAKQAISLCVNAADTMADVGNAVPTDLKAQIVTCHGRNLMQSGARREGEEQLVEGMELFRQLTVESGGASVYQDAYAEVMFDLGRAYLSLDWRTASHWLLRAAAQKRYIARQDDHPLHWASLAETLIELGRARAGDSHPDVARRHYLLALMILEKEDTLPGGLPEMVLALSQGLISDSADFPASAYFSRLAQLLIRAGEIADKAYPEFAKPRIAAFNRLWLTHFLDHDEPIGLLQLLSFTHGRRLATLAHAEIESRSRANVASDDEREYLDLRRKIHRLDLEMAEIISARSPSLIREGPADTTGTAASDDGQAARRAGSDLRVQRDELFRRHVAVRDRLIAQQKYPDPLGSLVEPEMLQLFTQNSTALAVWCIPAVFGVDRAPRVIVVFPGAAPCLSIRAPQLNLACQSSASLLASWRFGRSGARGSGSAVEQPCVVAGTGGLEAELWQRMAELWEQLAEPLRAHGVDRLDMITHAEAHNLPWLGSCPESLQLRQFPSLNFFVRRNDAHASTAPSPENPLILLVDDARDDPLNTLYQVPLEVEAIRQIWPGAVIEATETESVDCRNAAAVWIIGHGITDHGQPLVRTRSQQFSLGGVGLLQQADLRVGLIYASTCYLGQTTDLRAEPVGLPSLAASRAEAPYAAGAVAPIDDLGAAFMALLLHYFWRADSSPRAAFDRARNALATGAWPQAALDVLASVVQTQGPEIIAKAKTDATIGMAKVAELFPELAPRRLLVNQFHIRRHGRACLETWKESDDVSRWISRLHDTTARQGSLQSASRFLSWFG